MHKKISNMFSSFGCLNGSQFFSIINDNFFKLLLIFFLISLQGKESSSRILAFTGILFVLPFIFLGSFVGYFVDRYDKIKIIRITRLVEIVAAVIGTFAFYMKSIPLGYITLVIFSCHSAFYSPAKFGIVPELVPADKISNYNGILSATGFFAIIAASFLVSFSLEKTDCNYVFCGCLTCVFAVLGTFYAWKIKRVNEEKEQRKISFKDFSKNIFFNDYLKNVKKTKFLFSTIVAGSYFLFVGAFVQLEIIPFSTEELGLTEIESGYIFLLASLGIGLGSFVVGKFSGKQVELGWLCFGLLGVSGSLFAIGVFASSFISIIILIIILGIFGGFCIVPANAFIQVMNANKERGMGLAVFNCFNFLAVFFAPVMIAIFGLYKLTPALSFKIVGIVSAFFSLASFFVFRGFVIRLILSCWIRFFKGIKERTKIEELYVKTGFPVFLVCACKKTEDYLNAIVTLPRTVEFFSLFEKTNEELGLMVKLCSSAIKKIEDVFKRQIPETKICILCSEEDLAQVVLYLNQALNAYTKALLITLAFKNQGNHIIVYYYPKWIRNCS